jgi:hypothetical protein
MNDMTWRGTLVWAALLAALWLGVEYKMNDVRNPVELASAGGFFFVVVFFSMTASTRLMQFLTSRIAKPLPPPPEPIEVTTARPEHVGKRRTRRRPRGRRNRR